MESHSTFAKQNSSLPPHMFPPLTNASLTEYTALRTALQFIQDNNTPSPARSHNRPLTNRYTHRQPSHSHYCHQFLHTAALQLRSKTNKLAHTITDPQSSSTALLLAFHPASAGGASYRDLQTAAIPQHSLLFNDRCTMLTMAGFVVQQSVIGDELMEIGMGAEV